jgi:hypothetical protein
MRFSWLASGFVSMVVMACGASAGPGAASTTDADSCVKTVEPDENCPATWAETISAAKAFCGGHGKQPGFSLERANAACGPWLRYTTNLFDGGPRNCLYDPKTEKLAAIGFFDGKAGWQKRSCNVERQDAGFPESCVHIACTDTALSAP